MSDRSEWELALTGNGEAFGRLFDEHRDRVFRHSLRLVASQADAEDVVAIVFLEAWRKRASVRFVDDSLLPWLLVTATNAARNVTRSARRYRALLERLPPVTEPAPGDDPDPGVREAFARLSRPHQQVLALCVLDGYSEAEAARLLGVPAGTVKSRLARARRWLQRELTGSSGESKKGQDNDRPAEVR